MCSAKAAIIEIRNTEKRSAKEVRRSYDHDFRKGRETKVFDVRLVIQEAYPLGSEKTDYQLC